MKLKKTAHLFVSALLLVFMFSGCGNSVNSAQQATFSTVQKGEVPPAINNSAQVTVIRNEGDWSTFWNLLYTNYSTKPALPVVNFNEKVIVAVVDTPRSTGGYSITIDNIAPTSSGIKVNSSQITPGQGCVVTQAFTQPFHIVTAPIFSGVATLELSQSVLTCGP